MAGQINQCAARQFTNRWLEQAARPQVQPLARPAPQPLLSLQWTTMHDSGGEVRLVPLILNFNLGRMQTAD